jgi:putative MATE family efflux protein
MNAQTHTSTQARESLPAPARSLPLSLERPVWGQVLSLAWPVVLQQWLVVLVSFSDRVLGGLSNQPAAQAAQTTALYLAWFLTCYTYLVTVGSATLVAHLVGAGDRHTARLVLHQSVLLATFLGLSGSAVGLIGLKPLLAVLQLHGDAAELAAGYLRPILLLLVFQMVCSAGLACLAGAGDTRPGLWILGGVAVLNVPLAWLFFKGIGPWPGLGFQGIAIGTALSQSLGGVAVVLLLLRGRAGLHLEWGLLRPRLDLQRRLLRISVPASVDVLSMQIGHLWFLSLVNGLGDIAAAAHGTAVTWEALSYQSGSAFGTAAVTVVGQSLGAGRPERATRGGWVAFALGGALMCFMGVLYFALAPDMCRFFNPYPEQEGIVDLGVPVLRLIAFSMPALASTIVLAPALRGAGDTRVPMLFTFVGFFAVRIPLAYLLIGQGLGLLGAWLAMSADLQVRGLFLLCRFAGGRWRGIRV